jgi:hypothetical protein
MTRRRVLCGLLLALVLGALGVAWVVMVPRSKINRSNFARIQAGMSQQQVQDILGTPLVKVDAWDEYELYDASGQIFAWADGGHFAAGPDTDWWVGPEGCIVVDFSERREVVRTAFHPGRPMHPGWFERVRGFLGL